MFIFGIAFADMSPTQSGEICTIQWTDYEASWV